MNSKRQAKQLLKAYGKELYQSRVEFMNSFDEEPLSFVESISYKFILKRCATTVLTLTLTLSLFLMSASALGISLFGLELTVHPDNDEYRTEHDATADLNDAAKEDASSDDGQLVFYEATYIPEGYELTNTYDLSGISRLSVYSNGEGQTLKIDVSSAEASTLNIDNERNVMREEVIDEKQVIIYDFDDDEEGMIYLMQEGSMLIKISGTLSEDEFEKIIYGLQAAEQAE